MLLDQWMEQHKEKDCYPPTIINITDGEFNGASKDTVLQNANELKSMFTNDGNVILFNIHFTASNADIEKYLNDNRQGRHVAMGVNVDATTLIKLMDIGTPTNINQNQ